MRKRFGGADEIQTSSRNFRAGIFRDCILTMQGIFQVLLLWIWRAWRSLTDFCGRHFFFFAGNNLSRVIEPLYFISRVSNSLIVREINSRWQVQLLQLQRVNAVYRNKNPAAFWNQTFRLDCASWRSVFLPSIWRSSFPSAAMAYRSSLARGYRGGKRSSIKP